MLVLLFRLWWLSGFIVSAFVIFMSNKVDLRYIHSSSIINTPPTTIMTSLTLSNFCYLILSSVAKCMQLVHARPTTSCIHLVYCVHMILCDPEWKPNTSCNYCIWGRGKLIHCAYNYYHWCHFPGRWRMYCQPNLDPWLDTVPTYHQCRLTD